MGDARWRIRTIHPEIAQSRGMRRVSRDARLLFTLLLTVADDAGRLAGRRADHPTISRLPAPPKFAKDSRIPREETGKLMDENDNEAVSRKLREPMEIPRTADGRVDLSAEWLTQVVTEIMVESKTGGSKDIALRSAHMLGRKLRMWGTGASPRVRHPTLSELHGLKPAAET